MHTNGIVNGQPGDCSGNPFNFEPEYSSAAAGNIIPWGFGAYNINSEFEIGHFEPCKKITGPQTLTDENFTDTFWTNCNGPYEAGKDSAVNPDLEADDSPCYPFGDTHGGTTPPNLVTGCDVFFDANGDLIYDGTYYRADWPTSAYPGWFAGAIAQAQPTTGRGQTYPHDPELGCTWQFGRGPHRSVVRRRRPVGRGDPDVDRRLPERDPVQPELRLAAGVTVNRRRA